MPEAERSYHALLVEDTQEMADLVIIVLKRIGVSVHHANNGQAAIEYIDQHQPDIMLLDLNLPGVNGWDVLKHLYARYGEGTVPVIVTSAYSDGANRLIGKLQEVRRYLIKPFSPQELMRTVSEVLGMDEE